ncbi:MAG: hypothetical protein ACTHOJ_02065 [Sphingomonas oligoaromativorans]
MATDAFQKIKAGLEDAIAYAKGDASRGRVASHADDGQAEAAETRRTSAGTPRTSAD